MKNKNSTIKKNIVLAFQNHKKNNFKVAESIYKKILKLNPNHFDSIFLLGSLLLQTKNYDKAIQLLNKAIQIKPDYADAYHNLGLAFLELGEFKKAMDYSKKAIQTQHSHVEAYNNLGNVFKELREFSKAKNCYLQAIQIQPNHAKAHNNLGNIMKELGEFEKAIDSYQKAIQIQPFHANAHYNLGLLFKVLGKFEKTIGSYQMAIRYEPENLIIHYELSNLKKEILDTNLKNKVNKIIKEKKSTKQNLAYGNFLLSKYELKDKNYEKEFNYLIKGHFHYFESEKIKFEKETDYWLNKLPNIKELVSFKKSNKKNNSKIKPIFIIGVPRCGSTLVEKVIASGSKEIPMGEEISILSYFIGKKIGEQQTLNFSDIKDLENKIIEEYKQNKLIQEEHDYVFTDKSLDNFFYMYLIKEIFPNAKIINCRRNALSSIMSILKTNLRDIPWAHNLEHIFKFFNIYYQITENFKKKFPNFIYDLDFEEFINNPKIESKKLLKFCNLPWDKKCLEFYRRNDLVSKTASNIQIRKAIYKDPLNKNLPYKKFLDKYGKKYSWFN